MVCVRVSQLNSFSVHTGGVEVYRYCAALRIVSLPLYHTPSRSHPQTESGGPGLFHFWLWQRNGARGPLLLLIRADAWLSCMPAAQPNRDYVPGWWRQKKGHSWDLCLATPLGSWGYFIICALYLMNFAQMTETKYLNNWNPTHNTSHTASSPIVRVGKSAALLVKLQSGSLCHLF